MSDQLTNSASDQVKPEEEKETPKKFILVAEDDKLYTDIYKVRLTQEGFDVKVVEDGEQALQAARERKPDLIVLDLIMPVKDGFETLKDLKADPNLKDINVIVVTVLGQEEDTKRAQDMGAVGYFVKTNISIHGMVDTIKEYL